MFVTHLKDLTHRRCIVYVRVSTEDQARKGYSLADQVELCTARAVQLGYPKDRILVLRDEGISGDVVDRPGLNRLRELVADAGSIGHVVIYDPDRFARNLSLQLIVTEEIVKGGAVLEFINFEWKNTPEGKLFYSLRGAIAEYEKAKIKERTRRGREQKAKQGLLPVGKSLYGFHFNPETDKLDPVPEEQAVLKLIKDLVLYGPPDVGRPLSCVQAAKWLAKNGIPAPQGSKWWASTITKMLRSESYTGTHWVLKTDSTSGKRLTRPKEQQYKVDLPPVWDEATRQALIARIESNRWKERGRKSLPGHYLLKGLVYCGVCGDGTIHMSGRSIKDHRRDYQYYVCYRNNGRAVFDTATGERIKCQNRHWPARVVDDTVWNKVKEAFQSPETLLERFNALKRSPAELTRLRCEHDTLTAAIAQKEAEGDRYLRLFATGHIDTEAKLDAMLGPIKRELAALKERLNEVEETLRAVQAEQQELEQYLLTVERVGQVINSIADDDYEAKRDILKQLVRRVILGNDGVRIIGYLSLPLGDGPGPGSGMDSASGEIAVTPHANRTAERQLVGQ